jgi:Zn-finger nucleic acid-binding protein
VTQALICTGCGAPLPAAGASVAVTCGFCGLTAAPAPAVIERVVEVNKIVERVVVRDTSGAPATLACLRCGQSMQDTHIGETTYSQCRACGGLWLSPDAVERLRRVSDDELRRAVAVGEMLALARPARGELACPVCKAPLERLNVRGSVHEVDVCRAHGTWFDRTELLGFMDAQKRLRENAGDDDE